MKISTIQGYKRLSLALVCALLLSALPSTLPPSANGWASSAHAHQQKQAITTVLFNPRTNNIEIMHRFEVHDAEHAVKEIFGGDADIINKERTQQAFTHYVVQRFAIYNQQKQELPLRTVGYELEGKHFWVYQETPAPEQLKGVYIAHNALRDIWQSQTNTINVEGKGDIQTLTFSDNVEVLSVSFKTNDTEN